MLYVIFKFKRLVNLLNELMHLAVFDLHVCIRSSIGRAYMVGIRTKRVQAPPDSEFCCFFPLNLKAVKI